MIRIIVKFSRLFDKRQKGRIVIIFFMMTVRSFLEVASVGLMIPLVSAIMNEDIINNNKYINAVCRYIGIHSHKGFVIFCLVALIFIFIFKNLYMILECYVQGRFIFNNRFATQKKILTSYMKRPYEFFLYAETGEITRTLGADVSNSFSLLMTILAVVSETMVSLTLGITIFLINPFITVATAIALLCTISVISIIIKPILKKAGRERQIASKKASKWVLQSINGIKEIKISQTEKYFESNYNKYGQTLVSVERKNQVYSGIPRMLIEMITICCVLCILIIMILRGYSMMELVPALSAFAMAAMRLIPSANRIVVGINAISYQELSLDELLKCLEALREYEQQNRTVNADHPSDKGKKRLTLHKEIMVKGIEYAYPNTEKNVLDHADMVIPVGKSVGIVGASGNGKTTTVDLILGLLKPQAGQVLCDGVDITEDYAGWLTHIGYIPQMIFMLDDTIRANVAFGRTDNDIDDKQVWDALEEARLAEFVRTLPKGLDTGIGERGIRISGGQRQRIGIARALFENPDVLIFDEATSALDNETEAAIMDSINALHGRKTIIIIAHRLTTIEGCDMIYRVENGKILREK